MHKFKNEVCHCLYIWGTNFQRFTSIFSETSNLCNSVKFDRCKLNCLVIFVFVHRRVVFNMQQHLNENIIAKSMRSIKLFSWILQLYLLYTHLIRVTKGNQKYQYHFLNAIWQIKKKTRVYSILIKYTCTHNILRHLNGSI